MIEEENQSRNHLSLEDEDIDEVDVQKLKNKDLKGKKRPLHPCS